MNRFRIHPVFLFMGGAIVIALLVSLVGLVSGGFGGEEAPPNEVSSGGVGVPSTGIPSSVDYYNNYNYEPWWYFLIYDWGGFLAIPLLIAVLIVLVVRRRHPSARPSVFDNISMIGKFFAALLTLALAVLFGRIWMDLEKLVSARAYARTPSEILAALFAHSLFVLSILAISFLLYYGLRQRQKQYTVLVLPYFVASSFFSIWLLLDSAQFALTRLGSGGVYIVLFFVIMIFSGLLFLTQRWEHHSEQQQPMSPPNAL